MIAKTKTGKASAGKKRGRAKVGKLKLNRDTVKDLTGSERKQIKGGITATCVATCPCAPGGVGGVPMTAGGLCVPNSGRPGCALGITNRVC